MLSEKAWSVVEEKFGPHSVDLMALDSNAMSRDGKKLRHFTPFPTPYSDGTNVFAQKVAFETNPYVFPHLILLPHFCLFYTPKGYVNAP